MKTSWRRFQNILKTSWKCLEDVLKTSWRRLEDVWARRICWSWWRHLEDVLKTSSEDVWVRRIYSSWSRHLEYVFWRRWPKTSARRLQDVFIKTNVCWVEPFLPKMNHLVSRRQNRYLTVQFFVIILWKISIHLPVQSSFFKYHWF